jgi:hypothetical protein
MTWLLVSSVIGMFACPSISETILGWTPCVRRSVAHVCLRSWKRMSGKPAFLSNGFQCLWWKLSASAGSPLALGSTRLRSDQVPFDVARFLRYRRRASVAPAHLDQDHAPYARIRPSNTKTLSSGHHKARRGWKPPAGSPKKRGRGSAVTPRRKPSPASPSNSACNRRQKPTPARSGAPRTSD